MSLQPALPDHSAKVSFRFAAIRHEDRRCAGGADLLAVFVGELQSAFEKQNGPCVGMAKHRAVIHRSVGARKDEQQPIAVVCHLVDPLATHLAVRRIDPVKVSRIPRTIESILRLVEVSACRRPVTDKRRAGVNIAAVMAGAKDSVESMARLETWLGQPVNARHATEPLVALLMAQMGSKKVPGWLRDLGTVRNTMLHRQPMGANPAAGALRMGEIATRKGSLRPLRLVAQDPAIPEGPDPFGELVTLYNRFEMLAIEASRMAPHKAEPPLLTAK